MDQVPKSGAPFINYGLQRCAKYALDILTWYTVPCSGNIPVSHKCMSIGMNTAAGYQLNSSFSRTMMSVLARKYTNVSLPWDSIKLRNE